MLAKAFAHDPLDPVPIARIPDCAPADGDPQTRAIETARTRDNDEEWIRSARALSEYEIEAPGAGKPLQPRQPGGNRLQTGVRRALPFRRRAFNTRRPPRVRMRARKP